MDWITTTTLLERLRDFDDRSVWNAFAERFRRPIVTFGRKLGLEGVQADDLAQEVLLVFARAFRDGKYDREKGSLGSWLFGIAQRQVRSMQRKAAREGKVRDAREGCTSFWQNLPGADRTSALWEEEWEMALVDHCLRQIRVEVNEATYRAFDLVVRKGKTPDEAAGELGMTKNAVYVAKHRVLRRLRELSSQYDEVPD